MWSSLARPERWSALSSRDSVVAYVFLTSLGLARVGYLDEFIDDVFCGIFEQFVDVVPFGSEQRQDTVAVTLVESGMRDNFSCRVFEHVAIHVSRICIGAAPLIRTGGAFRQPLAPDHEHIVRFQFGLDLF